MTAPKLRRVLSLSDLILYGIVLVQPIAPVPLFGLAQQLSHGHAVTTILLAMVAMVLDGCQLREDGGAVSVRRFGVHLRRPEPATAMLDFSTGWAMFLDYLLVPLICTIYGAVTLERLCPRYLIVHGYFCFRQE